MLSIAMARLKIPGFELELFEFLCIITHPHTLKEVPKKTSHMFRREKPGCEVMVKVF